jgi:hypothetical protein
VSSAETFYCLPDVCGIFFQQVDGTVVDCKPHNDGQSQWPALGRDSFPYLYQPEFHIPTTLLLSIDIRFSSLSVRYLRFFISCNLEQAKTVQYGTILTHVLFTFGNDILITRVNINDP